MKSTSITITVGICLLLPALYYSEQHNDLPASSEIRRNYVDKRREQRDSRLKAKTEDRKQKALDRKNAFLERKKERDRKNGDRILPDDNDAPARDPFDKNATEDLNYKHGNANERTDSALSLVKNILITEEPIVTGDTGSCSNCDIYGISSVERTGRATAIDIDEDRKRVKVYLGLRHLNVTCNCTFGLASGVVTASVKKLVMYLDVLINFNTDAIDVKNVTIKFPGKLDFDFAGNGVIGWIYQIFIKMFKSAILNTLQYRIVSEIPKLVRENKEHLRHMGMI